MSTFLRGFLHPHTLRLPSSIRASVFIARPQFAQPLSGARSFSAAAFLKAQVVRRPPPRTLRPPPPSLQSPPPGFAADPVLRVLSETGQPVVLYQAPFRLWYTLMVYGFASGCCAGGLWIFKFASELPKDLPFFVEPTYWVVSLMVLGSGLYAFTAPAMRCSSLELLPALRGGPLRVRIKARVAPIPFIVEEKVIVANLGEVTMSEKTVPMIRELQEAERARRQDVSEGLRGMFIVRRYWEIAARLLDQKWTSFFCYFKFAVLRFGVSKIQINGDKWKMDCSEYLRENGQAVDRFISVDEDL
ncbi:hypothetical protein K504DRAFT_432401 [Pleomassaria siparia CBS 279.74]|uniref:Uncharacterized protein n=1 Tax=Pleomassaria siparia CBS 279.74 TaxID=1314801 RepID=A0A6G1K9Y9_9PLEO|nr:hypothetical protein K504DRAFT_432401 [Pleomassaria siparia CBS 279.74]